MTDNKELHPKRYLTGNKDQIEVLIIKLKESGNLECWDVLEILLENKKLTPYQAFLYGNQFKYGWRLGEKDDPTKEIDKQIAYLQQLKQSFNLKSKEKFDVF